MTEEVRHNHGDIAECKHCGKRIHFIKHEQWNGVEYDTLDSWWSHMKHPADDHNAEPKEQE